MKFSSMNLLEEIAKPELADLLAVFRERTFTRQAIIFQPSFDDDMELETLQVRLQGSAEPGEHPDYSEKGSSQNNYVFIVRSGRVRVYLSCGDKEFTIAVLDPGDIYVSHSNTFVQAMEDCTLLLVDTPTFNRRMMAVPQFTQAVVRVLGGILKNAFNIIDGLALRDVTARLAIFLLDAARIEEDVPGKINSVHLNVTGELLAQHLGTSRQTISTLLNDFTRSGILAKEKRGVYRILDERRLRELM